jgi:hypothetical protein
MVKKHLQTKNGLVRSLRLELFADRVGHDLGPVHFGAGDGQQPAQRLERRVRPGG